LQQPNQASPSDHWAQLWWTGDQLLHLHTTEQHEVMSE
jgi:hypothetical protein